jgi:hypothetical protein
MATPGDDAPTGAAGVSLRPYDPRDEDAAIALWLRSWQGGIPGD